MRKITVSVSNDLLTDNRVRKTCISLQKYGFKVFCVGIMKKKSQSPDFEYPTKRIKTLFTNGFLYYTELNTRLFFYLLWRKSDLLWANDLDTLPANYLISKIKKNTLIFDSHEHFTQIPHLKNKPQRKVWLWLERRIVPNLKHIVCVCNPIKDYFKDNYSVRSNVIRNFPFFEVEPRIKRKELDIPNGNILIWQGSVNIDRGLEELCLAMRWVNGHLLIIGNGDIKNSLTEMVKNRNIPNITFKEPMSFETMMQYTRNATLGLSIDKPTNENYLISLPNKVFEYIHAGLPFIVSDLPELKKTLQDYDVCFTLQSYEPRTMAKQLNEILSNPVLKTMKQNCYEVRKEFCWQNEETKLFRMLKWM